VSLIKYILPSEREYRSFASAVEYPREGPLDTALLKPMINASAIHMTVVARAMEAHTGRGKRCSDSKLGRSTWDKDVFGYATICFGTT